MAQKGELPPLHWQALSFIFVNISRLPDDYIQQVKEIDDAVIETFERGRDTNIPRKLLFTGSSAEGLCLDYILHCPSLVTEEIEDADMDCMVVDGRFVATGNGQEDVTADLPIKLHMVIGERHHPGYCSLAVDRYTCKLAVEKGLLRTAEGIYPSYMREYEGKLYMSSELYSETLRQNATSVRSIVGDFYRHGPAITGCEEDIHPVDIVSDSHERQTREVKTVKGHDIVPAFEVDQWSEIAKKWAERERQWPELEMVQEIIKLKCHLVPTAHRLSKCPEIEWRLSFSIAEKHLARSLKKLQRQFYIFFKYIIWKPTINERGILSSYLLKTTFFWLLEEIPKSYWKEDNFAQIVLQLIDKLLTFITAKQLPNYFLPTNNMIDHFKAEDLDNVIMKINDVKSDILSHILNDNTGPSLIILNKFIFKKVFHPLFSFMKKNNSYFYDLDLEDRIDESEDECVNRKMDAKEVETTTQEDCQLKKGDQNDRLSAYDGEDDEILFEACYDDREFVDTNMMVEFNQAKTASLLNLARIYQGIDACDFTVQILTDVYQDNKEDDLTLPMFITEMSLSGATSEAETILNIIQLHEYLNENTFPGNIQIKMMLTYLHLCLAGVSTETEKNKELDIALSYLQEIEVPASAESDMLRARIEAAWGRYDLAQNIVANSYLTMKEAKEVCFAPVYPVEYSLLPLRFRDVMVDFACGQNKLTYVPVKLFTLFLDAFYQSKLGMKDGVQNTCKEFKEQLELTEMDETDKQLGEAIFEIMLNIEKDTK